ncbi:MAG: hypothetical protein K2X66_13730 [Cyanobacteria bacterium]|nr:hypothetical protein [Cyanobacteriota bacterium]
MLEHSETNTRILLIKLIEELQKSESIDNASPLKKNLDILVSNISFKNANSRDSLSSLINSIKESGMVAENFLPNIENMLGDNTDDEWLVIRQALLTLIKILKGFEILSKDSLNELIVFLDAFVLNANESLNRLDEILAHAESTNRDLIQIYERARSLQDDTEIKKQLINEAYGSYVQLINKVKNESKDFEAFSNEIARIKERTKEEVALINESQKNRETFLETSKSEIKDLKITLENEIRELLPGAGAAGLSATYVQAKSKYGAIEYDKAKKDLSNKSENNFIQWIYNRFSKVMHIVSGNFFTIIYYIFFLGPLLYMYVEFRDIFGDVQTVDLGTLQFKVILSLPLGCISYFGFSSIRLNRRLYEEYNHKQRVMQLYYSFKDEVEKHGGEENQKALLAAMILTVQDKPSLAMNKYDNGIEKLLKKFLKNMGKQKEKETSDKLNS